VAKPAWRPGDAAALDEVLHLLARAIQQFHTYPPTSPLCQDAIDACQRGLVTLEAREHITFQVGPHELIVDEVAMGAGTLIEQELARRLHAASIAQVTIERDASRRELSRFCFDLVESDALHDRRHNLIDLLDEHGVQRIQLRAAYRPQVLEVRPPAAPIAGLIGHQCARPEEVFAAGGAVDHLYPPDKGWVRVDPTARLEQVSLVDLALLAQDPHTLAGMLLRLTDDDASVDGTDDALSRKFSDVATLFAALDPQVSRVMFAKLARAVLDLDPVRRQTLLRKTILPGLLDGRIDGTVLRDFPDVELAESLCLLLDLETAAPEVVTTALARLELPSDRQAAVLPLVESQLEARATKAQDAGLDAHARKLTRIDKDAARSFAEFAAFDLSVDSQTATTLAGIRESVAATDPIVIQLECICNLVRLEPNPETVQRFSGRSSTLLDALEREGRWVELVTWLTRHRDVSSSFRESRPDVADVIDAGLASFITVKRAQSVIDLAGRDAQGRAAANAIIVAVGPSFGPALIEAMQTQEGNARPVVQLLSDHAKLVAPALVDGLDAAEVWLRRLIARVLGLAGTGYEQPLASMLSSGDEQTVREALRSLAKIGTPRAAALVSAELENNSTWVAGAAEQTLWHFPKAESHHQVRELLGRRDFVLRHPQVAARLLERVAQAGATGLEPTLHGLVPLRYRFWNPALVRVARQARTMLGR
jgi:HEAT repeats